MCDADDIRKTVALLSLKPTPQTYPPKRVKMRREDGIKFAALYCVSGEPSS